MLTITDRVRFVETDMMGVVHHANYFRWFEMGRVAYLREAGVYLLDLMDEGILFPITDVSCQYRSSARFDDEIIIETTMAELTKVRMVFSYRVLRAADGLLLATGRTQNAFADEHGKIIRLPAVYFDRLQNMFTQEK